MSRAKTLSWGIVVASLVGATNNAGANPFNGGSWAWTSYEASTDSNVVTNLPSASASDSPPPSATLPPTASFSGDPSALASGRMVTNAGGSADVSSSPFSLATSTTTSAGSQTAADGYINFSTGPYPEASALTTGGAQAWYLSPVVEHAFGGVPSASQQSDFANQVLKDVQQTFALSGLSPNLTIDPTAAANHTISVVSNTSYGPNGDAIGIADVGRNGFSFIDKLNQAQSVTELEWAMAHNVAHELMHAFGVGVHHDQTGTYLDAATASWSLLTDPNTIFSPAAVQDILGNNYGRDSSAGGLGTELIDGDQQIQAVPEPTTVAIWLAAGLGGWAVNRRRRLAA